MGSGEKVKEVGELLKFYRNNLRNSRLLHSDAIQCMGSLHGEFIMCNENEL
jgi:hypothetical protein